MKVMVRATAEFVEPVSCHVWTFQLPRAHTYSHVLVTNYISVELLASVLE